MENQIFALDIGTRSVTGLILKKNEQTYEMIDYAIKEHDERSMLDGQIHNVLSVAQVIKNVKEKLEENHGPLTKVSVAAAGRSLKTVHGSAEISLDQQILSDSQRIKHLELSAVQAAQLKLAKEEDKNAYKNYYCVGYSVLHYKLDDELIGSLIDQRGAKASVKVIATFLPKVVVESLMAALERAELQMDALTLEPIAAIHVLIPPSMRRLNVALVDIGAGTSDIALTKDGTITAYGMVPLAGDQVTECLSDAFLLDFKVAEKIKRKVVNENEATVEDILGFEHTISLEQLKDVTQDTVHQLATALTEEILNLNERPPQAVMLIGGGSQTPGIETALAKKLQLPKNRVAVRGIDAIQNFKAKELPTGPDFVTPVGIAITSHQNPVRYITVTVNGQNIPMFEMREVTIGDCLIQAGINLHKMYGKPGLAAFVTVNGEKVTIPGELGEPPLLQLNEEATTVDTPVQEGDQIIIKKGADGKKPSVTLEQFLDDLPKTTILFNQRKYTLPPTFYVNDQERPKHYKINDQDTIEYQYVYTIKEFLEKIGESPSSSSERPFTVIVNDEPVQLPLGQAQYFLNEAPVEINTPLEDGDHLQLVPAKTPTVKDLLALKKKKFWEEIEVIFNGEKIRLKRQQIDILRENEKLQESSVLQDRDQLTLKQREQKPFIFQDIFRYVNLDLTNVKGTYELLINDAVASFYSPIQNGDHLSLKFHS